MKKNYFLGFFSLLFFGIIASFVCSLIFHASAVHVFSNRQAASHEVRAPVIRKVDVHANSFHVVRSGSFPGKAYASDNGSAYTGATAFIAIDNQTGNVLVEKNAQISISIASITKLMTAVVALDLAKPSAELTISQQAANEIPTTIGIVAGQHMTVDELLHAMLMTSANDAAQAVKDGIDAKYGSPVFIAAMNEKAKFLGLTHTHFANPQGFDNQENYSSAEDLAVLTHYALTNYPPISDIVHQDFLHMDANAYHKQFDLNNWNGLLGVYPGAYGVKIGNTGGAGYTTIVAAKRDGKDIVAVLLNAPGVLERDMWTAQLLDTAFSQYNIGSAQITQDQLRAKYATWQYFN